MNAANLLTALRLVLTLPILLLLGAGTRTAAGWAFGLFTAAMLTDVLDGMLARRNPERSPLGNYLDPVADKVLLMCLFVWLAAARVVPVAATAVMVAREFVVNGVRAAGALQGVLVGSNWMGKTKTLLQAVAVGFALFGLARGGPAGRGFLDAAWWLSVAAASVAAVFAVVFVYWNRSLFRAAPGRTESP